MRCVSLLFQSNSLTHTHQTQPLQLLAIEASSGRLFWTYDAVVRASSCYTPHTGTQPLVHPTSVFE